MVLPSRSTRNVQNTYFVSSRRAILRVESSVMFHVANLRVLPAVSKCNLHAFTFIYVHEVHGMGETCTS